MASKIIIDTICRNNSKRIGSKVNWSHATSRWSDVCDCKDLCRGGGGLGERGEELRHRVQQSQIKHCNISVRVLAVFTTEKSYLSCFKSGI